jgi:hypothetical protein
MNSKNHNLGAEAETPTSHTDDGLPRSLEPSLWNSSLGRRTFLKKTGAATAGTVLLLRGSWAEELESESYFDFPDDGEGVVTPVQPSQSSGVYVKIVSITPYGRNDGRLPTAKWFTETFWNLQCQTLQRLNAACCGLRITGKKADGQAELAKVGWLYTELTAQTAQLSGRQVSTLESENGKEKLQVSLHLPAKLSQIYKVTPGEDNGMDIVSITEITGAFSKQSTSCSNAAKSAVACSIKAHYGTETTKDTIEVETLGTVAWMKYLNTAGPGDDPGPIHLRAAPPEESPEVIGPQALGPTPSTAKSVGIKWQVSMDGIGGDDGVVVDPSKVVRNQGGIEAADTPQAVFSKVQLPAKDADFANTYVAKLEITDGPNDITIKVIYRVIRVP